MFKMKKIANSEERYDEITLLAVHLALLISYGIITLQHQYLSGEKAELLK
jgi:hypothetical protein